MSQQGQKVSDNNEEEKKLKNIKEIDSLNDLKLDEMVFIRGDTPLDIEEKCLKLCKDYLSGNWNQQTLKTVTIKRIIGGMVNQIYHCAINEQDQSTTVPQEVAVRFYGKHTIFEKDNTLKDTIISLILSENKIGAKIYGVFEGGLIQKYYPHRQFKKEEQLNTELVEKVFKTLAKIHSLEIPIKKYPAYFDGRMEEWYQLAYQRFPIEKEMDEYKCETLKKTDLKAEINWFRNFIDNLNSPIVFTHRDYRSSNLMITEPNDELVVCDYDMSSYCHRGIDFFNISLEFCEEKQEFKAMDKFPLKDSVIIPLIKIYVEECERIHGKCYSENQINSVENILKEIKIFCLFNQLLGCIVVMLNDETAGDFQMSRRLCMEMAEMSLKNYLFIKQFLINEKIIQID